MSFKPGDTIVCINNTSFESDLNYLALYTVKCVGIGFTNSQIIQLVDDSIWWCASRFQLAAGMVWLSNTIAAPHPNPAQKRQGLFGIEQSTYNKWAGLPEEKKACSCDFVTVILPYGCKCGGI